jgi:hypothetical protein
LLILLSNPLVTMHLTSLVVIATGLAELGLVSGFRLPLPRLSRSIRRDDSPQVVLGAYLFLTQLIMRLT